MASGTTTIRDLLKRDLNEQIEEIIKVYQADEETVYHELTEYVATNRIREGYRTLLKAMADAPVEPHEGVGIWISGFFGSGKSSFAKNLGYVLANRTVRGHRAADLFKAQLDDPAISQLVDYINQRIPTEVIMFDVSVDRAVRNTNQKIADIMYTVLLRQLGYAQDFDLAELEIALEAEGKLDAFERLCQQREGKPWSEIRISPMRLNRASTLLHEMDPRTFPAADSYAKSLYGRSADITVAKFVDRAFELMDRRRPGKALTFIIDEVGQYVAQSGEKIEDLRAVVERFGQVGRTRVRQRQSIAPVWVAVTSQEKLDEVVAAIDARRVELAKVQDRFSYRVDLAPADIREVATKRVLGKKREAEPVLSQLFTQVRGQINTACRLENTTRASEVNEAEFAQFYPYLPHFIELSIDIMSGIRIQPGAPRHLGGSNRTIIKQAHEMLISPRTNLANKLLGALVTLDLIYELVEGNLSSERQKDISDITERFKGDSADGGWAARVAKAICLLEFVRDLPRTEANIAAVLVSQAGDNAPVPEVRAALERLEKHQFARHTEEGWKLQTAQEKQWDTERKAIAPKPVEQNAIRRDMLVDIFREPSLRTFRHPSLPKNFDVGVTADGARLTTGAIPMAIVTADDASDAHRRVAEARDQSRMNEHANEIYWVYPLNADVDRLINEVYASGQMIGKYDVSGAQGERAAQWAPLLEAEKRERDRLTRRLHDKLTDALAGGTAVFRGVARDGAELGRSLPEMLRKLFQDTLPDLYPKLELGARRLTGNETEEILKAARLNLLPQVFYGGEHGLNLVIQEGQNYVVNHNAEIAQEILGFLKGQQQYGTRVTGKDLEQKFTGLGYGWDLDVTKLALAALLRAGAIEVTYQGRKFRNAQDPQSRTPLTSNPAFRAASFAPRESIDLRMLTAAVRNYEDLTGDDVDVEEGAIADALKRFAEAEIRLLLPIQAEIRANNLPGGAPLDEYYQILTSIQNGASDDCVRLLSGEGRSIKTLHQQMARIRALATPGNIAAIRQARRTLDEQWPQLVRDPSGQEQAERAKTLHALLDGETLYDELGSMRDLTEHIASAYAERYQKIHGERFKAYSEAIDSIKGREEWTVVIDTLKRPGDSTAAAAAAAAARADETLLLPLTTRACEPRANLADGTTTCLICHAPISQIESDLAAVATYRAQALEQVAAVTNPPERTATGMESRPIHRVRAANFFGGSLSTEEDVQEALSRMRDELLRLIGQGARIIIE